VDEELDLLLGTAINSLTKLEILLYLGRRASAVQTGEKLAAELTRPAGATAAALEELAALGLVDRFALGTGRHVMYGAPEEERARRIVALVCERYHGNAESRSQLIRRITGAPSAQDSERDG
jgi:hypothetical protein